MSEEQVNGQEEQAASGTGVSGEENGCSCEHREDGQASNGKVPLQNRVIAAVIDSVIAFAAGLVVSGIIGIISSFLAILTSTAVVGIFLLVRDSILGNGQSPGKKVMKYQVVGPDGSPCTQELSIKRNLPLAAGPLLGSVSTILGLVPIIGTLAQLLSAIASLGLFAVVAAELYFIYKDPEGLRWGDKFAGTSTRMLD